MVATSWSRTPPRGSAPSCGTSATWTERLPRFPALRVDHVSIAVPAIAPALDFFRRPLPIRMGIEPRPGYDGQFTWTDFFVGDFKLELIESARPGSFVERFLARRGEGFHHLSLEVEDRALDA